MKSVVSALVILATVSVPLLTACSRGSSAGNGGSAQRSSLLTVSASRTAASGGTSLPPILVNDGALTLQSAVFSIDSVVIEENTGEGGGGGGDGQHGNQGNDSESDGGGDAEDIVLHGPFSVDIAAGDVELGTVAVYPGTFMKVDLALRPADQPHSILVTGNYVANAGGSIPFTLRSAFAGEFQAPLAGGGITVGAKSVVPIVVSFDLAGMFNGLDFAGAAVVGGEILIDDANNTDLLQAFEAQLGDSVEFGEGNDGGDGD